MLLGAGASAAAGVPMTVAMLDGFREHLAHSGPQKVLLEAIEKRISDERNKAGKPGPLDIEPVIEAIRALEDTSGTVSAFFDSQLARELRDGPGLMSLRLNLQDYIRDQCMVRPEALGQLRDFRRFFESFQELDIFTVNYDVVVELLCELDRIDYSDGFKLEWDPLDFAREGVVLRLHKLHGSAIWSEAPVKGAIKVPLRFQPASAERLTGEQSTPLMVYPAEKWNNSNVFIELNSRFASALREYDWLVVVGYSFRDRELNNAILEAARDNPNLQILIVSPSVEAVYDEYLKRYAEPTEERKHAPQRPLLEHRVVRLPYRWESVLPDLASGRYGGLNGLQQTLSWYWMTKRTLASGGTPELGKLVLQLLDLGALDQADDLLTRFDWVAKNQEWQLELACSRATTLWALGDKVNAESQWKVARAILEERFISGVSIQVSGDTAFAGFTPKSHPNAAQLQGASMAGQSLANALRSFERLAAYTAGETRGDWIRRRRDAVQTIATFYRVWSEGPMKIGDLLAARPKSYENLTIPIRSRLSQGGGIPTAEKAWFEAHIGAMESTILSDQFSQCLGIDESPAVPPNEPSADDHRAHSSAHILTLRGLPAAGGSKPYECAERSGELSRPPRPLPRLRTLLLGTGIGAAAYPVPRLQPPRPGVELGEVISGTDLARHRPPPTPSG